MEDILDAERSSNQNGYDGPSLEELNFSGYTFDFGKCFEIGWKAFSKDIGSYILFTLVAFLIFIVSAFTVIGLIIVALPLTAGPMMYGAKVLKGEQTEFNDFFSAFKFTGPLLGYVGLMILVYLVFAIPIGLLVGFNFEFLEAADPMEIQRYLLGAMLPFQLFAFVFGIFLQTVLFFVIPLIVLGKLGTMDAIRWSIKIALKNFWWILLYTFVVSIISQAGAFACYIGLLFTFPLAQCLNLGAYTQIIGLGDKSGQIVE